MTTRASILDAALRLFAETGSRGATTRRIAEAAGVNEVTLFRHFGSKQALLDEALRHAGARAALITLPAEPADPHTELVAWCLAHLQALHGARSLLRSSLSEVEENAAARAVACGAPVRSAAELCRYVRQLQEQGQVGKEVHVDAATALLMGGLLADAISRDVMPERYPYTLEEGARHYVALFLRSIGMERQ